MIIQGPYPNVQYILYMPEPELGDARQSTLELAYFRNMSNDLITYIRRNNLKQYNWQFVLTLAKMWELYYFLREFGEHQLQIIDHNDRVMVGYLTSSEHDFTHESRGDMETALKDNLVDDDTLTEEIVTVDLTFLGRFL